MGRKKKQNKSLNCRLDRTIWNALDLYCQETGCSKTFATEKALKEFLERYREDREILKKIKKIN